ncbi:succinate dehydrogenase subunit 7A, mitochondrial-like [Amaranthus tricolor]|uniref:succinate dehydrogenase subunit 7A, mitochondrial-like n=1 Tax=Amaranthus tricolor TaxID=29722 RepID=UPI002585B676|nr:succinate dehydrogenase subunit 7A, mitochondrial-like [Amaranthus tricolor]
MAMVSTDLDVGLAKLDPRIFVPIWILYLKTDLDPCPSEPSPRPVARTRDLFSVFITINSLAIFSGRQRRESMFAQSRRVFHIDLGEREKALLEKDSTLSQFKSYKQGAKRIKRVGDVLTVIVVAGCCYEIYVRASTRAEARSQE